MQSIEDKRNERNQVEDETRLSDVSRVAHQVYLHRNLGFVGAFWGVGGAMAVLGFAVARMVGHCVEAMNYPLAVHHWIILIVWTIFMAYSEGYRGFQRGYSPRVAARALYLRNHCTSFRLLLAPLFCMGIFDAPRRRRITVFVLIVMITMLVILFRQLPQPMRGVLDFGVVIGLSWGILATLVYFIMYLFSDEVPFDAEVRDNS